MPVARMYAKSTRANCVVNTDICTRACVHARAHTHTHTDVAWQIREESAREQQQSRQEEVRGTNTELCCAPAADGGSSKGPDPNSMRERERGREFLREGPRPQEYYESEEDRRRGRNE